MSNDLSLVGKTISGVVASPAGADGPARIWMLQFTDGSHVEFVSPKSRRALARVAGVTNQPLNRSGTDRQMSLNVA